MFPSEIEASFSFLLALPQVILKGAFKMSSPGQDEYFILHEADCSWQGLYSFAEKLLV